MLESKCKILNKLSDIQFFAVCFIECLTYVYCVAFQAGDQLKLPDEKPDKDYVYSDGHADSTPGRHHAVAVELVLDWFSEAIKSPDIRADSLQSGFSRLFSFELGFQFIVNFVQHLNIVAFRYI